MRTLLVLIACLALASSAAAQQPPPPAFGGSHWGISGTIVPQWEFIDFLEDSMERSIEMTGADFQIGIIRGSQAGDEWGVSYVARRISDDSVLLEEHPKCFARPGQSDLCARGTIQQTQGATLTGVQVHRFFAIGTIAQRVQVGAVLSGGVGRVRGEAVQTQEHLQVTVNPATGAANVGIASESEIIEAREIFDHLPVAEFMPMGGAEGAVAVLIGPQTKLRFSAGFNFPGFHRFAITAQYLFGR